MDKTKTVEKTIDEKLTVQKGFGKASTTSAWKEAQVAACEAWGLEQLYPGTINLNYRPDLSDCVNFKKIECSKHITSSGSIVTLPCELQKGEIKMPGVIFVVGGKIEVSLTDQLPGIKEGDRVNLKFTLRYEYVDL